MPNNRNYPTDEEGKRLICEIGRRMYNKTFVAANDGNISIKCGPNEVWTTPTGVSKGYMEPEMLVKVDLEGNIISGDMKPSSEIKMHLRVYKENNEVNAVVHAHPPVATSYAIAGISLEQPISPEAIVVLGNVPVAPYATPGTEEVPESISPFCKDYNAVLLANHGALTWGRNLEEAYFRMESLEHYALMHMYSNHILKRANELTDTQIEPLIKIRESLGVLSGGTPVSTIKSLESNEINMEQLISSVTRNVLKELLGTGKPEK